MQRKNKVFIIAEAGVNHNNNIYFAKKLIKTAKKCGADAIKFQVFKTENYIIKKAPLAGYQKKNTNFSDQFKLIKRLELSEIKLKQIMNFAKKNKIKFLASAFDNWGIDFLDKNKIQIYKIPSGEITNYPYLKIIAKKNKEVILSTGMSNMHDVSSALKILMKFGLPKKKITLLQCNTDYPTPLEDVNLNVLKTYKKKFNTKIGLSDHTNSVVIPSAAVALGAEVVEKHLTLNKKLSGPDHKASLNPSEFTQMVKNIRETEKSLGISIKKVTKSEKKNILIARKSIVAKINIKKGQKFKEYMLACKRPAAGLSPIFWNNVLKKKARKNYKADEMIKL